MRAGEKLERSGWQRPELVQSDSFVIKAGLKCLFSKFGCGKDWLLIGSSKKARNWKGPVGNARGAFHSGSPTF